MTNNPYRIHQQHDFFTQEECNTVKDLLLSHEEEVLKIPHQHHHNGYSGITNKLHVYNWLEHTELRNIFTPKLFRIPLFAEYNTLEKNMREPNKDIRTSSMHVVSSSVVTKTMEY